ncbi:unnamed protein product [Clonostachys chloroleuca]|uniref:Gfo/Idh/MocA-like oxidoreductase N-terminal domain-containing protein n=1 Tax=Clonostachys chloroleuca TaxID=1926264 RepID=A0AA35PT21_9HYPO|nr:unnamed protein product [Clonostachys chloroleuca]
MPNKVFNVGAVGYGLSAKVFHIPFIELCPHFRLHSIVQRTPTQEDSAPVDYPHLTHYNDAKMLATDPEVDVAVITSTPETHYSLSKTFLLSNKHILVEKPFVPSSREAEELAAMQRREDY